MEETELQSLVELNKQFEEFRLNLLRQAEHRARHFEEQKLHGQNMEKQMMEMKEILISMAAHQVFDETSKPANTIEVVQIDESSEDGGEALFEVVNRIERDEDPPQILEKKEPNFVKESSDSTAHQVLDKMPSDLNHDLAVHQVLEEMSQSTKTIEVISVLTKDDDDDDLLEMARWIEEDCEPPTYAKGYMRLTCFDPGGEEHKNLKVFECAVDAFSQGAKDEFSLVFDFLTWEIFVGFVPRISQGAKNYCDETLIFDPGGLIVINNFSFLAASGEPSFGHTIDVGELELSLEDFSYVGSDSHGAGVVVFDPGGECSMLTDEMLELKQKTCRGHCLSLCDRNFWAVKNVSGRILVGLRWWNEIDDLCEMYGSLNHFDQEFPVYFCLILGDKDHLKEGVLLQENGC